MTIPRGASPDSTLDPALDPAQVRELQGAFLRLVFADAQGYLCIAAKRNGRFDEHYAAYPEKLNDALDSIAEHADDSDVYYCAQMLDTPKRVKDHVSPRVGAAWADLDECPPARLLVPPTLVTETSPGRWQALWIFAEPHDASEVEQLSKRIARFHKDDGCDQSGWDLTQLLRVPMTWNRKYDDTPPVRLDAATRSRYRLGDFTAYPPVADDDHQGATQPLPQPQEPRYIPTHVAKLLPVLPEPGTRHQKAHELLLACWECGMDEDHAYWLYLRFPPVAHKDAEAPGWAARNYHLEKRDHGYHLRHKGFWCHEANPVCESPGAYSKRKLEENGPPASKLIWLSDIEPEQIEWLWKDRIPLASVTSDEGDPDVGKSVKTCDLAARVSRGWAMPGEPGDAASIRDRAIVRAPATVLIISAEDSLKYTIVPRLIMAGADMTKIATLALQRDDKGNVIPLMFPEDLGYLRQRIMEAKATLVILDPLMAYMSDKISTNNDASARRVMTPLAAIAEELKVAILVVRHLNKSGELKAKYRGGGSIAFTGAVRSGMVSEWHPERGAGPGTSGEEIRVVAMVKHNLTRQKRAITYTIAESADDPDIPVVVWGEELEMDADALLKGRDHRKDAPVREQAEQFLESWLANGPASGGDLVRAAKAVGISEATLNRAAKNLGIKKLAERNEKGHITDWVWSMGPYVRLPAPNQDPTTAGEGSAEP
jgi:hypothetical protein